MVAPKLSCGGVAVCTLIEFIQAGERRPAQATPATLIAAIFPKDKPTKAETLVRMRQHLHCHRRCFRQHGVGQHQGLLTTWRVEGINRGATDSPIENRRCIAYEKNRVVVM